MHHTKSTGIALALLTAALGATTAHAQFGSTITLNGTSAPTISASSVGQTSDASVSSGSQDFTDNPVPGQTFTTKAGAAKYLLTGITLKGAGNSGYSNNGNPQDGNFVYGVSSVSGNTLTRLANFTAAGTPLVTNNQYFTADVNQVLNGNTQYAFDVYSTLGYFGLNSSASNVYSGGASFNGTTSRAFGTTITQNGNDRAFIAQMSVLNSATVATSTTFTQGTGDIGQFTFTGALNNAQDYGDNSPHPGQTFTTGSGASSFALQSLTVKGGGSAGNGYGGGSFFLRISQVGSGSTLTPLAIFQASAATAGASDFLTFDLTSAGLSLAPNTQYAYDIFNDAGYYGFAEATGDVYSGGSAIGVAGGRSFGSSNGTTAFGYDRFFDVKLAAAPEPSQVAAFGLGILGLGGLALRARRRSVRA